MEFQSDSKRMKQQLIQRISDSRMDLIKKNFIDKHGAVLKEFNYKLDDERWRIDNSNINSNNKKRQLQMDGSDQGEPPRKKSRIHFDLSNTVSTDTVKAIAERFDMSDNGSFIENLNNPSVEN